LAELGLSSLVDIRKRDATIGILKMFINSGVGHPATELIDLPVEKLSMGMLSGKSSDFFSKAIHLTEGARTFPTTFEDLKLGSILEDRPVGHPVKMTVFDLLRNGSTLRANTKFQSLLKSDCQRAIVFFNTNNPDFLHPKGKRKLSVWQSFHPSHLLPALSKGLR
jgi:hypothetical protein